jgi:hypothetical protein
VRARHHAGCRVTASPTHGRRPFHCQANTSSLTCVVGSHDSKEKYRIRAVRSTQLSACFDVIPWVCAPRHTTANESLALEAVDGGRRALGDGRIKNVRSSGRR